MPGKLFSIPLLFCLLMACQEQSNRYVLQTPEGKTGTLGSIKSKAILVHFWASWCAPCIDEIPELYAFAQTPKSENLEVALVSLDRKWDDAKKVLPSTTIPPRLTLWLDPKMKLPGLLGTYQYPETYLLGRDWRPLLKWVGPQKWMENPEITSKIQAQWSKP